MKMDGVKLKPPAPVDVVLPRGDTCLKFKLLPIFDFDEFEAKCPMPEPPLKFKLGEKTGVPDRDHPEFKAALMKYWDRREGWMYLKSMSATPTLEFETVSLADPNTWSYAALIRELRESGFTALELNILVRAFNRMNILDEKFLEQARERFLRGESAPSE